MSFRYYVHVTGKQQGPFPGESLIESRSDWLEGLRLRFASAIPLDVATGVGTGRVRNDPLYVLKRCGKASPQLYAALWSNELLEVKLEFVESDGKGTVEEVYERITLGSATLVAIERRTIKMNDDGSSVDGPEFEELAFRFEEITLSNLKSQASAQYALRTL